MRGRRSDEGIVFFKVSGASAVGVSPLAAGCRVRVSAGGRCARPAQAPSGARGNAQLFQTGRKGTVHVHGTVNSDSGAACASLPF